MADLGPGARAPKCPGCRWHLAFEARDKSWEAHCWNPNCKVDLVPPIVNLFLLALLRERGEMTSPEVARELGISITNANHHLKTLGRLGLAERRALDVPQGRKFAWKA